MVVDTIKENLCVNNLIATKKEIIMIEGDMIVPDSKPDILNTICTSGVVCIYKKEILNEKIKIEGNVNTYIMYLADDNENKVRGINTNLDFSQMIQVPKCMEGMECKLNAKLKNIESRIINGRKVRINATIELEVSIYSHEEVQIVNDLQNAEGIQMLNEELMVNSLVGNGETKIYVKDTISIDNVDNLAEILKIDVCICDKDIKISYNKILTKAEAQIKLMYLTEDNRINSVTARIPVVGFIDIPSVTEGNICDTQYQIKNIIIKPNTVEEHSIYVEMEVGVIANVYENKKINLIQDLYSPCENIEFNKKKISTITAKRKNKEQVQIKEKVDIKDVGNKKIFDIDIIPIVQNEKLINSKIIYEGKIELKFLLSNDSLDIETRNAEIPFECEIENIEDTEMINTDTDIEIKNSDFVVQDGGIISANIDMIVNNNSYKDTKLNIIDEIQTKGNKSEEDYSVVMYIVKKGDTLWDIAKKYGSTIDDIVRANAIEDANKINPGEKLYIPKYTKVAVQYA